MTYVLAAVGFMLLVVLHEAGHFAVAKAVGMRVEKFSLFFGPMLVKWRRGETVYGIGPIPLGGYVKISGMNPYEELPPEVASRAYFRQPVWKRIVVILAGPAVNLVIAFLVLWGIFVFHGVFETTRSVGAIEKGSPASRALKPGDRILSVDGNRGGADAIRNQIASHRCTPPPSDGCVATTAAVVKVQRGRQVLTLRVHPTYDATPGIRRTRLGFTFGERNRRFAVIAGAGQSVSQMWTFTSETVSRISQVFVSSKARSDVHGVVGGFEQTREAIKLGVAEGLFLIAVVSLSLGVINLFPFLPLDGGHVFWALAEKIRGRSIPFSVMERAGFVGFALVIALALIGLTNDINTLTGRGFGIR